MSLAVVRDIRDVRDPVGADEVEALEIDVLAGFVLARSAAGLADSTIRADVGHLDRVRTWFGRPLWEIAPSDADIYLGKVGHAPAPKTFTLWATTSERFDRSCSDGPNATTT